MRIHSKPALAAAATTALAVASLLVGAGAAAAVGTAPPWVGTDANEAGGLEFFNSSGVQITGGSLLDGPPLAAYVVGTTVLNSGNTKATLYGYLPNPGAAPGAWTGTQLSGSTPYPNGAAPGALASTSYPVETGAGGDGNLATLVEGLPNTSSQAGYSGAYELRLKSTGGGTNPTKYDYADITISNLTESSGVVTGGTWAVTYTPDPSGNATTTTIDASTPTTATDAAPVTLTADVSNGAPGAVQFFTGTTAIGSPVAVSAGAAALTTILPSGTDQINAAFTPTALSGFVGSASANYPIAVSHVVQNTTITASHAFASYTPNPDSSVPAYTPTTLTATVNPAIAGTVTYLDNGTAVGTSAVAGGIGHLVVNTFGPGAHSITESFTPSNTTDYSSATTTAPDAFTLGAAAGATPDVQQVSASVPAGALAISTPYNGPGSLLGTLQVGLTLNSAGTELTGTAAFGNTTGLPSDPLAATIKIVDTRTGGQNWNASAQASALINGTNSINAQNVGLVGLTPDVLAGNHLTAANTAHFDNPAAGFPGSPDALPLGPTDIGSNAGNDGLGTAHSIAKSNDSTNGGTGTIGFTGTLQISAPTQTATGTYTGTITFTVA